MRRLAALTLLAAVLLLLPARSLAAEVLQVRSARLLQVGDHNRTYTVELACLSLPPGGEQAATDWLRGSLPRRTRVNLRPMGSHDGTLVARVQRLGGDGQPTDLSQGLIAAGLAEPEPGCG